MMLLPAHCDAVAGVLLQFSAACGSHGQSRNLCCCMVLLPVHCDAAAGMLAASAAAVNHT
jgi:hypothetical protein